MKINKKEFTLRNSKGFTLIELLVVIAVIGILSAVILLGLQNARLSARDARRLTDIKQLQNALELYNTTCNHYPPALSNLITPGLDCPGGGSLGIQRLPTDPSDSTLNYGYCVGVSSYTLSAQLEAANPAIPAQASLTWPCSLSCSSANPTTGGGTYCQTTN